MVATPPEIYILRFLQSRCIAKEIWKTYLLLMVGLIACSTNVVGHTLASVCIAGLMVGGPMEALI